MIRKELKNLKDIGWEESRGIEGRVSLLFGEAPVGISESIKQEILRECDNLNYYPDPLGMRLIKKLSSFLDIPKERIVVANGIDNLLNLIAMVFIERGNEVITLNPSFPCYKTVTQIMGGKIIEVNLEDDFSLDLTKLISRITEKTKLIFIANPNNPTGNILLNKQSEVKGILQKLKNGILVLDECYFGISDSTFIDLVEKYDNLIILRSFSKSYGLAGIRVGYAIAQEGIINPIKKLLANCNPFILDRMAQCIAIKALEEKDDVIKKFNNLKSLFLRKLKERGLKVKDTKTTFLLLDLKDENMDEKDFRKKMWERGILIKDCTVYGLDKRYVRISIPEKTKMDFVCFCIASILGKLSE